MNWEMFDDPWLRASQEDIRRVNFLPYAETTDYIYGTCHPQLPVAVPQEAFIAGGFAVAGIIGSFPYNDMDVWLPPGLDWEPTDSHDISFESTWAKTYTPKIFLGDKIQVMKIKHTNPLDLIRHFDITLCQAVLYYPNKAIIHRDLWNYLQTGKAHAFCQAHNIKRMQKYAKKFTTPLQDMFSAEDLEKAGLPPGWTLSKLNALLRARMATEDYEAQANLEGLL
jgi:hypothetical protein